MIDLVEYFTNAYVTTFSFQKALILRKMWSEEFGKKVKGAEVLKTYEIQGL